jgi:DNA-binding SARP family transcriptional activator/tetratricopeptide (TPR) repeat protein
MSTIRIQPRHKGPIKARMLSLGSVGGTVRGGLELEFRILGALEVLDGSRVVALGARRKRAVLAILLLHLNRAVSSDRLIEELWGERPPSTGLQTVRVYVSQIRKALGNDLIRTLAAGYVLELGPDQLDAHRFERLLDEGRAAIAVGDAATAAAVLHEGLDLWRGAALADFTFEPFAQAEIARLEGLRVAALDARIDADLALGGNIELVGELEGLIAEYPLRERFRGQLMLALYRAGRQSDALDVYREGRRLLVEELGIEPGPELRALESAILRQDASLVLPSLSRQHVASQSSVRKTVTIVHVDLGSAGDEMPDPEAFARRLEGPLEQVLAVVGRHQGAVAAGAGDAVAAVFGLPALHEDDALRAVRAAVDLREQLAERSELRPRVGIATGEVVASDRSLHGGPVAGSAARLANAAEPGEIVLDDATRALVANAVNVEPVAGVPLFRLRALLPGAPPFARRLDAPLVGRRDELAELVAALESTIASSKPALAVLAGPPGIGKSRLAGELLREVSDRATALVGRCLSYGQGITLWPLREMVREAAGEETREALAKLLGKEPDGPVVAERIAAAFGLADMGRPAGEAALAFRRLFETLARSRPHVLVIEDAHWAEPALLDLLEYVSRQATDAPLLTLCLARPELFEARPAWATAAVALSPLSSEDTEALIDNLAGGRSLSRDERSRVVTHAEGNALFAEQFVALLATDGGEAVPSTAPTIHAILAARLDRLGPGERAVAERAAVVGREFTVEAVAELLPPRAASSAWKHLDALSRKMLVQPDRAVLPGKKGFRFQHALIHDAAYRRLPKALRAELHERFADWLEDRAGLRTVEFEEVVGYHLERACRYRLELGADPGAVTELAERAVARLGAAGRRAFQRTDFGAAVGLLSRALELMAEDDPASVELLNIVGTALSPLGEFERRTCVLEETIGRAKRLGDRGGEWQARLELLSNAPNPVTIRRHAERALRVFEELDDPAGATRASQELAAALLALGRGHAAEIQAEKALTLAGASGVHLEQIRAQWALGFALLAGPTPVVTAIARCERLLADAPDTVVGTVLREVDLRDSFGVGPNHTLGVLQAMNGDFGAARELVGHARSIIEGIAHPRPLIGIAGGAGDIEVLAGDPARAETLYRDGLAIARELGELSGVAVLARSLAETHCLQGRVDDAARELAGVPDPGEGDLVECARWLATRARVLALQGDLGEAERLAREATALVAPTDLLNLRGDVTLALAEVLWSHGCPDEATAALSEAVRLYEQKGNVAAVAHARAVVPAHSLA